MSLKYYAIQWPFSQYFMSDQSRTHLAEYELYDLLGDSAYLVREDYYEEITSEHGHIEVASIFNKVSTPSLVKRNYEIYYWLDQKPPQKEYFVLV